MKFFAKFRKFGMTKIVSALMLGAALAFSFASCENEVEKEVEVEKTYAAATTFTAVASEDGLGMTVTIATATEDATIYYTTDGTTPTAESTAYTTALTFTEDTTLKAIAIKEGIENSPVSVAIISIKEKTVKVEVEKIVEVDKKADETAPANVTNLVATAKDSRVLLTWTDASDEDIYGYEVSCSAVSEARVVLPALESTSMMVAQGAGGCYVSALTNGTEYMFTVKSVDTSGNKSEGVTARAKPKAGAPLTISLKVSVPQKKEGYTLTKSNTTATVTASITTQSAVKQVVYKKDGSLIAKTLLADTDAVEATVTDNSSVWVFTLSPTDETANGTYTVAAIDEAGREETEQVTIDCFDFTPPKRLSPPTGTYSSGESTITLNWTDPDAEDFDHVEITYTKKDGTSDSKKSDAVSVSKGACEAVFTGIDGTAKYYTYYLVCVDEVGNKSNERIWKVAVSEESVRNVPEGFVEVTGGTVTGAVTGPGDSEKGFYDTNSEVFIEGRTIEIGDLYVCDHEVTQKEYETYCNYNTDLIPSDSYGKGDNYPAYYVGWYDAIVYCNLRSIAEGLPPVYSIENETDPKNWAEIVSDNGKYCGATDDNDTWNSVMMVGNSESTVTTANGYRLPTEAEWEYIARGGKNGIPSTQYTYSGSDTIDDVAWYEGNNGGKIHEVKTDKVEGTDSANTLGIYDMSGNVCEWCWDWHTGDGDIFTVSITSDTPASGASSGDSRVLRGGYYVDPAINCTVSYRNNYPPYTRKYGYCGFRVVRNAE